MNAEKNQRNIKRHRGSHSDNSVTDIQLRNKVRDNENAQGARQKRNKGILPEVGFNVRPYKIGSATLNIG